MQEAIPLRIDVFLPYLPYIILSSLVILTYGYTLKCGFVIDDTQAFLPYDGTLQYSVEDKEGNVVKDTSGNVLKRLRIEYGTVSRWFRYHLAGGNLESQIRTMDGKHLPCGKVPQRHHFISLVVFLLAVLVWFPIFEQLVGTTLALLTFSLFIVHPITPCGQAWISGVGYHL